MPDAQDESLDRRAARELMKLAENRSWRSAGTDSRVSGPDSPGQSPRPNGGGDFAGTHAKQREQFEGRDRCGLACVESADGTNILACLRDDLEIARAAHADFEYVCDIPAACRRSVAVDRGSP